MNKWKTEVIFVHQNLISNWLTYLVHAKSNGELISFWFSDRSVQSLVSENRSANDWVQTKTRLHFLADLWSQSEFRTQQKSQRKTDTASEMTRCQRWESFQSVRVLLQGVHQVSKEREMTSPADKSKTKSPKSPGLLSRLNCASGKTGKSQSSVPLTMAPATPQDMSQSYAEDPG